MVLKNLFNKKTFKSCRDAPLLNILIKIVPIKKPLKIKKSSTPTSAKTSEIKYSDLEKLPLTRNTIECDIKTKIIAKERIKSNPKFRSCI